MGGCATKPKVLKGDEGEVPAPAPPPEPRKETVPAVPEAKEAADVVVAQGEKKRELADHLDEGVKAKDEVDETKEVADDDDEIDDQANKRQSLSNLFRENEKKGSAESDNPPSEAVKQVSLESMLQESKEPVVKQESLEPAKQEPVEPVKTESVDPVKAEEATVNVSLKTEELANPIEQTSKPEFVDAPEKLETENSIEATPVPEPTPAVHVPETQNKETSADNKEEKAEVAK